MAINPFYSREIASYPKIGGLIDRCRTHKGHHDHGCRAELLKIDKSRVLSVFFVNHLINEELQNESRSIKEDIQNRKTKQVQDLAALEAEQLGKKQRINSWFEKNKNIIEEETSDVIKEKEKEKEEISKKVSSLDEESTVAVSDIIDKTESLNNELKRKSILSYGADDYEVQPSSALSPKEKYLNMLSKNKTLGAKYVSNHV